VLIFGVFFTLIIENLLTAKWNILYFKKGIPIYSKGYDYHETAPSALGEFVLNEAFKASFTPALAFKEIEANIFAFREKKFNLRYLSYNILMHGRLEIIPNSRRIKVIGLLNWSILSVIIIFFFIFWGEFQLMFFLFPVYVAIYFFREIGKYEKIGQFAFKWYSRSWSKKSK
jgi:hypothetical protein